MLVDFKSWSSDRSIDCKIKTNDQISLIFSQLVLMKVFYGSLNFQANPIKKFEVIDKNVVFMKWPVWPER